MFSDTEITTTQCKKFLTTANPFEQKFGYHRAVRRGPFITTSGTTALKLLPSKLPTSEPGPTTRQAATDLDSKVHFPGDAYRQTRHVLETCIDAVTRLGGKQEDVVRVRMFVANSDDCGVVGEAFKEVFGRSRDGANGGAEHDQDVIGTAATMIVVPGGFVDGEVLVEIEIEAFVM